MGRALVLAILAVAAPVAIAGQTLVVLHIRAVLTDATGRVTPVARHALILSDNPPTRETRRILTGFDGTANVRLRPGNYTVESDQPLVFQGKAYRWRQTLDIVAGRDSALTDSSILLFIARNSSSSRQLSVLWAIGCSSSLRRDLEQHDVCGVRCPQGQ